MSATPLTDSEAVWPSSCDDSDKRDPAGTHVDVDFARKLEHALRTIAQLADLPADATPEQIVQRVRDLWARDIHSCHDQCTRPLCAVTRERDALREDKARLDWLLDKGLCWRGCDTEFPDEHWKVSGGTEWLYSTHYENVSGRDRIDAARKKVKA